MGSSKTMSISWIDDQYRHYSIVKFRHYREEKNICEIALHTDPWHSAKTITCFNFVQAVFECACSFGELVSEIMTFG